MSAHRLRGDSITPALTYANKQIDQFCERGRLTFSELALIVEAIYMMSNVSGSLVFTYSLLSRAKNLILDERGFFTIQPAHNGVDHVIPSFLRDPTFYSEHKARYEDVPKFVPLFALGLGANTVVLKNTIWLQSVERRSSRLPPILLGGSAVDAVNVHDNKHAAVGMPVVYLANGAPKCAILQLPAHTFEIVRSTVAQGNTTLRLRKPFNGNQSEVSVREHDPLLCKENVQAAVGEFWQEFIKYANTVSSQNAKMPKNVCEAITHTLINSQKSLQELTAALF